MGFDELKDKAKDLIGQHGDKVDQGEDKLKEGLRNFGGQQQQ